MKKYPFKISSLENLIADYFEKYLIQNSATVPDTESLAAYLGITREELNELESGKNTSRAVKNAKTRIAAAKKQLAYRGKIPAAVLAFDLRNDHGYRDKPEDMNCSTLILRGLAEEWSE